MMMSNCGDDSSWNGNACPPLLTGSKLWASPTDVSAAEMKQKQQEEEEEEDGFYEKLNQSSGGALSLLLLSCDVPDDMSILDLHQLYKNVTQRGGYYQVHKDRKWKEVASSISQKKQVPWTPAQLETLYARILYRFEQRYHYRCPTKPNKSSKMHIVTSESLDLSRSSGKRKHDVEHVNGFVKPSPEKKRRIDQKLKRKRKGPLVPLGSRNCYQIFLKLETEKLKSTRGHHIPSSQFTSLVKETWKHLSSNDKLPYIQASEKDRERFVREMAAYEEHKRNQHQITSSTNKSVKVSSSNRVEMMPHSPKAAGVACSEDADYHVAPLQPDEDDDEMALVVVNETVVQRIVESMKNAKPDDPIFKLEWDGYGRLLSSKLNVG